MDDGGHLTNVACAHQTQFTLRQEPLNFVYVADDESGAHRFAFVKRLGDVCRQVGHVDDGRRINPLAPGEFYEKTEPFFLNPSI